MIAAHRLETHALTFQNNRFDQHPFPLSPGRFEYPWRQARLGRLVERAALAAVVVAAAGAEVAERVVVE